MTRSPAVSRSATDVPEVFCQALRELGLTRLDALRGEALTGGVSSDIWRIDTEDGPVCAKRALPVLKVAAHWQAPIERNRYEARWMQVASQAQPGCTPHLLGQHPRLGVLVMQWLAPDQHALWKPLLRDGQVDPGTARQVGEVLARIHAWSAARPELATDFDTDTIFFDIRLEPYLLATAQRHPQVARVLEALVDRTRQQRCALVHGDVSPKNILIGPQGPVFLDAECAWWGDPAFDLAFCLNHLLLKCVWNPRAAPDLLQSFAVLTSSYRAGVRWEPVSALEQRVATLLPGLMLARVDGKSPVEYLQTEADRDRVRRVALHLLRNPVERLDAVAEYWSLKA